MDIVVVKDIIIGVAAVLGGGLSIWTWLQSPSKANADAIKSNAAATTAALEAIEKANADALKTVVDKLTDHDRRIQTVEGEMRHLPSKDVAHELKVGLVELQGTVNAQNVQLEALGRLVSNMDNYLRKGDGK